MFVSENTDTRLVLRHRPWQVAALVWLIGFACQWAWLTDPDLGPVARWLVLVLGFGSVGAAWWYFPFTETVFDRRGRTVTHTERRLLSTVYTPIPLNDIEHAQVDAIRSDDGSRLTRLTLVIGGRRHPLEYGYGPADRRAVETAINEWLTRP